MLDESTLQEFYRDVPAAYLDRFRRFLGTHSLAGCGKSRVMDDSIASRKFLS